MSYAARVINVMIASPSDVEPERQTVRAVIQEWNAIHAEDKKVVLMPMGWESHASPKMGPSAQDIINAQVLRKCDLLVAVFWTRLGSPTGDSPSGTVDEINKHLDAGKHAMIYFSSVPVRLESVDDEQYKALVSFRQECERKGLVGSYDSIGEFHEMFMRQLTLTVFREFAGGTPVAEDEIEGSVRRSELPSLTDEAKQLLREASEDGNGTVLCVRTMGGTHVQTNNKQLAETGNARSEAKWVGGVDELVGCGLLKDRGHKGEVFGLTREGYDVAERLKQQ